LHADESSNRSDLLFETRSRSMQERTSSIPRPGAPAGRQPFSADAILEESETSGVAAGPRQAIDEPGTDRIGDLNKPAPETARREFAATARDCRRARGWVVRHRRGVLVGQHHHVQTILRHVDSAKREHLRIPSLLMRARALATVRVWKKRLERQAHSRFKIRSACGLPVATGRRS